MKSFAKLLILSFSAFGCVFFAHEVSAAVLLPGNVASCGELAAPGTYTLTGNVSAVGTSSCFLVSSDNVTIDGAGYSISGSGDWGIDARSYDTGNVTLKSGANGFTNLLVNNVSITGFSGGINVSGNSDPDGLGVNGGYGGAGGDVEILYSTVGSVSSTGGATSNRPYGGIGGNITFTDDDLDISNASISALAGLGLSGRNVDGGLDLNYTGSLNRTGVTLSPLSFFNDNATEYGVYPGGTWPVTPGTISSCGTLYGAGTYTLSQSLTGVTGTCFTIASNGVSINGAGYSISSNSSSTQAFAVVAGGYTNLSISSMSISSYPNTILSSSSVAISGGDLDLSNTMIWADSLAITYTSSIAGTSTATSSALSALTLNGISYGSRPAGLIFSEDWTVRETSRLWQDIASSANGMKLVAIAEAGRIYTSTDGGATWTARESNRNWSSVASSADGTRLVAVVNAGQIYTSTDSGVTWTARDSSRAWNSVASSADGTRLAASVYNGQIYNSTDSGVTWTARDSVRSWNSVASSADGSILAATGDGNTYTSTDFGVTWILRESGGGLTSVVSSADGTRLAAVVQNGQIYTSTDGGATWTARESNRNWSSVASSADGTRLVAVVNAGQIYTSTDSGVTWTARDSSRAWNSVASSADGTRLAAVVEGGSVYTYIGIAPELSVDILSPSAGENVSLLFSPYVSWGISISCYYSYDNFTSTSTADCSLAGADIPDPLSIGSTTLYVRGISMMGSVVTQSVDFDYTGNGLFLALPSLGSTYSAANWLPSVQYGFSNPTACYYSYDNFTSTSTADCSLAGVDILPPTSDGSQTLYVRTLNGPDITGSLSVNFSYRFSFSARESSRFWRSVASSADGTKLAAVVSAGQIYTSTDSGVTWTARDSSRNWTSITSSADGTKLAAVVNSGQIYTSTDSGVTWTARDSVRDWDSVASSADGAKLVAVVYNGQIYTSTDSGATWTARDSSRGWKSVASSADGAKLAAAAENGQVYTSTDSGATWTARGSSGVWYGVASSADGTKLVAVMNGGQIYASTDSGVTWTARDSSRSWASITSSADGAKLAAVVNSGQIYTSTDSGVTWTARESNRNWSSVASSADGTKLVAGVSGGRVYTIDFSAGYDQYLRIESPEQDSIVVGSEESWSPSVLWGFGKILCQYSYDGFSVATNTVSCVLGGADIPTPSAYGSSTLSVRAVDFEGNVVTATSDFFTTEVNAWSEVLFGDSILHLASSADGTKLAAIGGGQIYTSTDSGATWTARESSRNWKSIASSADGTKLVAVVSSGQIYTSTDSGATWTARDSVRDWRWVSSSADGTRLAAVVWNGRVYISSNSGATWTTSNSNRLWVSIASSADGTKLVAIGSGRIHTSANAGASWSIRESSRTWSSVASSADGTKLVAVVNGGQIYTSTDSGVTWTPRDSNRTWYAVASSADGTRLVAVVNSGQIYTSTDSGVTWTAGEFVRNWNSVASSADGTRLVAGISSGNVYTNIDDPRSLFVDIMVPTASSTFVTSSDFYVSWGSATSCFYSYDGFVSTSTADCALLGTDIESPELGTSTLSVRGIDSNGVIVEKSSTFAYLPYYWCGTADSNWANASNWYTTSACSVGAGLVPTTGNGAVLVGAVSPIVSSTTTSLPSIIDTTGLTGPANATGIIFGEGAYNTARIIGNATFESAVDGALELDGSMIWGGSISGTIKGGDGEDIVSLEFNGSSVNQAIIATSTSVLFGDSSTNLGTVQGDATFSNTSPFSLGTILGTAILNGISQTIQGVNNVINFIKESVVRDILYIASGGSLNVSGTLTLRGLDASNLLSVQSTVPGSAATISIPGSANVNFVRLRDLVNSGVSLNLSSATAYDDGGNSGFSFPSNSRPGSRSGLTSRVTHPPTPQARAQASAQSTATINRTTGTSEVLREFRKATDLYLSTVALSVNPIGRLPDLAPLPVFGGTGKNSFSFQSSMLAFVFEPLSESISSALASWPNLREYLSSVDVTGAQSVARLSTQPLRAPADMPGLYNVSRDGQAVQTTLSSDGSQTLLQIVRIAPGREFDVSTNFANAFTSATFDGKDVSFNALGTVRLTAPELPGLYLFRSSALPFGLVVRVGSTGTPLSLPEAPRSIWQKILDLFTG